MTVTNDLTPEQVDAWIGATVATLRESRLMTTHELADQLGMTYQTLRNKLKGDRGWSAHEIRRVAEFFDVTETDLFSGWGGRVACPQPRPPASDRVKRQGGRGSRTGSR